MLFSIRRLYLLYVAGAVSCTLTAPAWASIATANLGVSANVQVVCTISVLPMTFGLYASLPLAATATVSVQCTSNTPYNIGFDQGTGPGATVVATRLMTNGAATLGYSLYADPGHTTVWGNTIGSNTNPGIGTGGVQALMVYGLIVGAQAPAAGSYTDTVVVTTTY